MLSWASVSLTLPNFHRHVGLVSYNIWKVYINLIMKLGGTSKLRMSLDRSIFTIHLSPKDVRSKAKLIAWRKLVWIAAVVDVFLSICGLRRMIISLTIQIEAKEIAGWVLWCVDNIIFVLLFNRSVVELCRIQPRLRIGSVWRRWIKDSWFEPS